MTKPIIWTIVCILIAGFTIYCGMLANWFGVLIVLTSIACAALQWIVYYRGK